MRVQLPSDAPLSPISPTGRGNKLKPYTVLVQIHHRRPLKIKFKIKINVDIILIGKEAVC